MARSVNCDWKDCTEQMPNPFDDNYVTVMVTVGKGAGTRSLRRDLCTTHVSELADMLNAELVVDAPVPQQKPVDVTS